MIQTRRQIGLTLTLVGLLGMLAVACDSGAGTPTPVAQSPGGEPTVTTDTQTTPVASAPTPDKTHPAKVTIALGYIPDVQFAPFYVALNKGYFADQGLDVTLKHGIVPDMIKLLGLGDQGVNFAVASGDEIIPARLNDIPVKYIMTWYRQYPVAAVSIVGKGPTLKSPSDLKGKVIGVPGPYGSTYTGLLALLKAGGLTLNDITLKSIGFTQIENLTNGQVDVAMVYAANEPVQLKAQGFDVSTLNVANYNNLASNGLVTNEQTFKNDPALIARVVSATQRGIQETINDPTGAFSETLKQVPDAGGANKDRQFKVLQETIKLMQPTSSPAPAPGYTDPQVWSDTQDFLFDAKLIPKKATVDEMFTNQFVVNAQNQ